MELPSTFRWAKGIDISALADSFGKMTGLPILVVGSGGSLSTASLCADLLGSTIGQMAKVETPYLAADTIRKGFAGGVVLISAGGENPDVLGIAREAISSEVAILISVCCRSGATLSKIVSKYGRGTALEYAPPSGSDGFLATNTLVALNTIIARAIGKEAKLPSTWKRSDAKRQLAVSFGLADLPRELIVLFGPDTRAAAVDLESKFSEAALATVQAVDIRNFAHGRHNWLAKRAETGVIALAAKSDSRIVEQTLHALPSEVRKLTVQSNFDGLLAAFDMQSMVFELTRAFGEDRKVDPGRPGIPPFGRRIYHLNAFGRATAKKGDVQIAIRRKRIVRDAAGFAPLTDPQWEKKYDSFLQQLRKANLKQLVFDYDGTLCDHRDRYSGLRLDVGNELCRILESGIQIGIATGRGKSVRTALMERIPESLRAQVLVGYYNATVCLPLDKDIDVTKITPAISELRLAHQFLSEAGLPNAELTLRPTQLTVEARGPHLEIGALWRLVLETLDLAKVRGLKVVTSSRSIDIVSDSSSKMRLLEFMPDRATASETLFVGDRPRWPGNDHEILNQPFALSVDEVTSSLATGWNLAPAGILNADASLFYLKKCKVGGRGLRVAIGGKK